jgi:hypothetical protein
MFIKVPILLQASGANNHQSFMVVCVKGYFCYHMEVEQRG